MSYTVRLRRLGADPTDWASLSIRDYYDTNHVPFDDMWPGNPVREGYIAVLELHEWERLGRPDEVFFTYRSKGDLYPDPTVPPEAARG